jgi:hypothetical protein
LIVEADGSFTPIGKVPVHRLPELLEREKGQAEHHNRKAESYMKLAEVYIRQANNKEADGCIKIAGHHNELAEYHARECMFFARLIQEVADRAPSLH